MPRTPDRFPGTRYDTELELAEQATDPTTEGATRYVVDGDFRMRDQYGVFNPRSGSGDGTLQAIIQIALTGDGQATYQAITSANWAVLGYMGFPGTVVWGTDGIDCAGFIGWMTAADALGVDIRLWDATNGTEICIVSGITSTVPTIQQCSSVNNLPATAAVFEIQGKRNGNKNGACSLACLEKRYA